MSNLSAPIVRAALIALIADRPAMADVLVTHVWQGNGDEQEHVYLGATSATYDYATIRSGRRTRDEDYTVQVIIDVADPTDWGPASETRAFALAADVESMLADDPTVGLSASMPTLRVHVVGLEQTSGALDPSGIGSRIVLTLQAQSRLN